MTTLSDAEKAFEIYKSYVFVKLYFSKSFIPKKSSDSITHEAFLNRADRGQFYKILNKIDYKKSKGFFVANVMRLQDVFWVGEVTDCEGFSCYRNWLGRIQATKHNFKNNVIFLLDNVGQPKKWFSDDNGYPVISRMVMEKKITEETYCIILTCFDQWDALNEKVRDVILWPDFHERMLKYRNLLGFNVTEYRKYLKSILTNGDYE